MNEILGIINLALRSGFVSREDVIKWVDAHYEEQEDINFIDLSLAQDMNELIYAIEKLTSGIDYTSISESFMSYIYLSLDEWNFEKMEERFLSMSTFSSKIDKTILSKIHDDYYLYKDNLTRSRDVYELFESYLSQFNGVSFVEKLMENDPRWCFDSDTEKLSFNSNWNQ